MNGLNNPMETSKWNLTQDQKRLEMWKLAVNSFIPESGYVLDSFGAGSLTTSIPKKKPETPSTSSGIISLSHLNFRKPLAAATVVVAMNFTSQFLNAEDGTLPLRVPRLAGAETHCEGKFADVIADDVVPEDFHDSIVADIERPLTMMEAAREWDRIAKTPSKEYVDLPFDLED